MVALETNVAQVPRTMDLVISRRLPTVNAVSSTIALITSLALLSRPEPIVAQPVVPAGTAPESAVRISSTSPGDNGDIAWCDVKDIGIEGKGWKETPSYFDRLPARAKQSVRPPVWSLSRHSAGMCVRFSTNSTAIHVRWTLTSEKLAMPHMAATGVSGVDLYVRHGQSWRWIATGQPKQQTNTARLIHQLSKKNRDYLLYLPLYNGVRSVEIGVVDGASVWSRRLEPSRKPLVFWGTSITQGACASRPGMVHTAILGRRFERPVINLGFSGNGRMEPEVARLMSEIDAAVYVVDCLPNLSADLVAQRVKPVVSIIRQRRSETPILLVEDRSYANAFLVAAKQETNDSNRAALRTAYREMQVDGIQHLFYLSGAGLLGSDGEDTVDGSHPTDLGFVRHANAFEAALRPILD